MGKKIVLVTGANKGIGYGIAKHLGLSGWQVIIGARDEQRATKAISELKALGIDVLGWVNIELKDLASIEQAAKEINEKYPELSLRAYGNQCHPRNPRCELHRHLCTDQGTDSFDCQESGPYRQCHRTLRDQSLLAPVSLRGQQGCTERDDGCDGHRIPTEQYACGNFLRPSWSHNDRSERQYGPPWFPRHRDCRPEIRRTH